MEGATGVAGEEVDREGDRRDARGDRPEEEEVRENAARRGRTTGDSRFRQRPSSARRRERLLPRSVPSLSPGAVVGRRGDISR